MADYESDGSTGENEADEITTAAEVIQKLEEVIKLCSIFYSLNAAISVLFFAL